MSTVANNAPAGTTQTHHAMIALLCGIIPGCGQYYNKQVVKGLIFTIFLFSFFFCSRDLIDHGLWGLVTLGETVGKDNSIFLLAEGIITVLLICFALTIYYISLRDAYKNGKRRDRGLALYSVTRQYHNLLDSGFPYLMITPGFIILVFVVVFPIIFGFSIAFTNYNLFNSPPAKLVDWVGLRTFTNIFTIKLWRNTFFDVLQWTVVWTVVATTLQCSVGILLAILVNQKDLRFKPLIRTIFILPWAVPGFVTILVFAGMFNDSFGVINNTLVLQAIPDDLYEAATMDGAGPFTKLKTITLPLVLYSIAPIIITQYTFNFNNFNIIYLFNNGGPAVPGSNAGGTDILVSWIYKLTMSSSQYAIASAITILLSIFVVGVALWQFRSSKSFKNEDMM